VSVRVLRASWVLVVPCATNFEIIFVITVDVVIVAMATVLVSATPGTTAPATAVSSSSTNV
jgi:hypothetical protein